MRLRRSRLHLASLLVLASVLIGLGLWLSRSSADTVLDTLGLGLAAATFALDLIVYLRTPGRPLPPAEDQADELAQVETSRVQSHPSRFGPRQVEDLVDEVEHSAGVPARQIDLLGRGRREWSV